MLAIRDLSKTYANGVQAPRKVNLDIPNPYNKLVDRVSDDSRMKVGLR